MKKEWLAIFDLDGTLFDTKDVNFCAYKEAILRFGYSIDYDYYCKFCNGRHYTDFLPQITSADKATIREIHSIKKQIYEKYLDKAIPNKHLFNIIGLLRNEYYTVVVTTASKKNTYDILERFHTVDFFDLILTQEDVHRTKPDPAGFLLAMEKCGVDKEHTVIFEDSDVGLLAAKRCGAYYYRTFCFN